VFCPRPDRPLLATFDQPHASSDGGAILLKAAYRPLALPVALTATVPDARALARVTHGVGDLLAQRVFAIACHSAGRAYFPGVGFLRTICLSAVESVGSSC
jgi:hypothetical protein